MDNLIDKIWVKKWSFLGAFFLVFSLSYMVLYAADFLPEAPAQEPVNEDFFDDSAVVIDGGVVDELEEVVVEEEPVIAPVEPIIPVSLTIEKLNKTVTVLNPTSRLINDLDTALLDGVVRHPDSVTLEKDGTVFILGHSSYLPSVFNKNFQAFNGIQNLEWGDLIEVNSDSEIFTYRVEKVYRAKASDVVVPIAREDKMLVLATCNSFGSKDDRFIVEASFQESQQMALTE